MLTKCIELALRLKKPIVAFDIEHTGGFKEQRGITEFAAVIMGECGNVSEYSSLVKPGDHAVFNHIAARITGIKPATVKYAPDWFTVFYDFFMDHKDSLWVGFASKSSDMPIISTECERSGIQFLHPESHLDLLRVSPYSGSLSVQAQSLSPELDVSGAHRAAKDALMTMHLFESLLTKFSYEDMVTGRSRKPLNEDVNDVTFNLKNNGNIILQKKIKEKGARKPKAPKADKIARPEVDGLMAAPSSFLVQGEQSRKGHKWYSDESAWVVDQYKNNASVENICTSVGRSEFAIGMFLNNKDLLSQLDVARFNIKAYPL